MSGPLTEPVLYRLYLARQRLREGTEASSDPLPLGRMRALLALDNAAELVAVTLLPLLHVRPDPKVSLSDHLKQLAGKTPALERHRGPVERIRGIRNHVKHEGVIPSPEEARGAAQEVEAFVRDAILAVTGRALEEITLLSLLADEEAKSDLAAAQEALSSATIEEACTFAAIAFERALFRFSKRLELRYRLHLGRDALGGLFGRISEAAEAAAGRAGSAFQAFASEFRRALAASHRDQNPFDSATRAAVLARLGIDASELHRFEQVTPIVHVTMSGEARVALGRRGLDPVRDEAVFAIDFVIRSLLRIEDWARRNPRHISEASS